MKGTWSRMVLQDFIDGQQGKPLSGMYERVVQGVANPKDRSGFVAFKIYEDSEAEQQWTDLQKEDPISDRAGRVIDRHGPWRKWRKRSNGKRNERRNTDQGVVE